MSNIENTYHMRHVDLAHISKFISAAGYRHHKKEVGQRAWLSDPRGECSSVNCQIFGGLYSEEFQRTDVVDHFPLNTILGTIDLDCRDDGSVNPLIELDVYVYQRLGPVGYEPDWNLIGNLAVCFNTVTKVIQFGQNIIE